MKQVSITIALLAALLITTITSCSKHERWVKGRGSDVKNNRSVSNFTEINLDIDAKVELYQDSVYSVEMVGQQNVLNVITTTSNGTALTIDLKRHTELRHHNLVTIRIHMPTLTGLVISCSGSIQSMKNFDMQNLRANVSGSGEIYLDGTLSGSLTANISGSGDVTFAGNSTCSSAKYSISGSGNMNAEWLKAGTVDADISGSGNIKIYAVNQLNADISGSGDLQYRGMPSTNVKISGSGKLRSLN